MQCNAASDKRKKLKHGVYYGRSGTHSEELVGLGCNIKISYHSMNVIWTESAMPVATTIQHIK
jgi:hypothetical protein